ncbi:MAG: cation transporter [Tissierellia bacterium]|nr:cation transporter [Tissierellia bacterium]
MESYRIIGLTSEKQAKRIEKRFREATDNKQDIKIDIDNSSITLPDDIDSNIIYVISSFEHVSILEAKISSHDQDDFSESSHKHKHKHDHSYSHEINSGKKAQRNMLIVFLLNLFFSIAEFIFGSLFNSQAILSDAVHDLGDSMSIGIAWIFQKVSSRGADEQYSYGYRRFSLLGALVTSIVLLGGSVLIIIQTVPKLLNPEPIVVSGVFWVAIGAVIINGFSVWLMSRGSTTNEKLLNIHLFEDLFGWLAVLIMTIILQFKDWYILDPILSLLIAGWILYNTLPEFINISKVFLQAVPSDIDTKLLRRKIESIPGVNAISHFHIWSTDGKQHMMSITVTTDSSSIEEHVLIKQAIQQIVIEYNIYHVTVEILYDPKKLIRESI